MSSAETFHREEVLAAAERTFGRGTAGLAGIVERTLREQGEPNAYIAGREGSGAFIFGLRWGAGTLYHRIEGQQPVHWTGPSLGIDVGGDATKVFVLVYNLYDTEELFRRFPAGEGQAVFRRRVRRHVPAARQHRADPDPAGGRVAAGREPGGT